ncbi:hypothetical protein LZ30DRAFT_423735 [Colletotrichum cereale]|nr:hypothetical protein LZ30DRAFT_423735 [Colletotrichum cereale]
MGRTTALRRTGGGSVRVHGFALVVLLVRMAVPFVGCVVHVLLNTTIPRRTSRSGGPFSKRSFPWHFQSSCYRVYIRELLSVTHGSSPRQMKARH